MLKAAPCNDDWKVLVVVAACVTKVSAEKYDRSVKQSTSCLAGTFKLREQLSKQLHLLDFDNAKFSQFDEEASTNDPNRVSGTSCSMAY